VRSSESLIPPSLVAAYRKTQYRVLDPSGAFVLCLDVPSQSLLSLYQQHDANCAVFITAWNPFSEERTRVANERAQQNLAVALDALNCVVIPGFGDDPSGIWPGEPSLLALGINRRYAEQLGRKFGQNAIVWAGIEAIPRLILLR
jgi:hypothetical protein